MKTSTTKAVRFRLPSWHITHTTDGHSNIINFPLFFFFFLSYYFAFFFRFHRQNISPSIEWIWCFSTHLSKHHIPLSPSPNGSSLSLSHSLKYMLFFKCGIRFTVPIIFSIRPASRFNRIRSRARQTSKQKHKYPMKIVRTTKKRKIHEIRFSLKMVRYTIRYVNEGTTNAV